MDSSLTEKVRELGVPQVTTSDDKSWAICVGQLSNSTDSLQRYTSPSVGKKWGTESNTATPLLGNHNTQCEIQGCLSQQQAQRFVHLKLTKLEL